MSDLKGSLQFHGQWDQYLGAHDEQCQTVYLQDKTICFSLGYSFWCVVLITLMPMTLFYRAHGVDGCLEVRIRKISLLNVYTDGYRWGSLLQWGSWEFCSIGSIQAYLFSHWRIQRNLAQRKEDRGGLVAAIKYFKAYHGRRTEYDVGIPDCVPGVFFVGFSIAQNGLEAFMGGTLQCPFVRV